MALQYTINGVNASGIGFVWAGTGVDPSTDPNRYNKLVAAGAVFFPATNAAVAAAAAQVAKLKRGGGDPQRADAIMEAATEGAQTVQATTLLAVRHDIFKLPQATSTDMSTATAKGDAQAKAPSAHLNCPRNVQIVTASWTSTVVVNVVLTGVDVHGQTVSETVTIPSAGTTVQGVKGWLDAPTITSWDTPAGWTAGTFKLQTGTKLGLPVQPSATAPTALKEVGYTDATPTPANAAAGTIDAANGTYIPTTALDGSHDVEVWYSTSPAHAHPVS